MDNNEFDWTARVAGSLPKKRDLFFDGAWHVPDGGYSDLTSPSTGSSLGVAAIASAQDVEKAVVSAHRAFKEWRKTTPVQRANYLRQIAGVLRDHAEELALLDAVSCGNPVKAMIQDVYSAAQSIEMFAGLGAEIKGDTIPAGEGKLSYTIREPYGVCVRIVAYNHPVLFVASKMAAPLMAGNTVIMKPSYQAPLSAFRMMELVGDILPPGVLNVLTGEVECGEALTAHPLVPSVSLVGSAPVGRAIARTAADRLKHVSLELGGKNAMVVFPDADLKKVVSGAVNGMNFPWCGQSCNSRSRLFLHEDIHDEVLDGIVEAASRFKPGLPTNLNTTMGAIVSKAQYDSIMSYIEAGRQAGARLMLGGGPPSDPQLANGFFIMPTIFADVTMDMTIAREEIFGPVLSVLKWRDEEEMLSEVNGVDYGLIGTVYTSDLNTAHRISAAMEAGCISINDSGPRPFGVPFGGYKLSGFGRETSIEELLGFTQIKSVTVTM